MQPTNALDRDKLIRDNPLDVYLRNHGVKLRQSGSNFIATRCPAVQHKPNHWCVTIDSRRQLFHCNDCDTGGSIIDWISIQSGKPIGDVMRELAGELKPVPAPTGKPTISSVYDYTDENGNLLYQVVRMEPKDFRQRQPDGDGWKWTMDGVTRVLYRLPEVLKSQVVCQVEGEKDADTLTALGYTATCNVGGAGKWLDAYSQFLKGKDILIFPDNDRVGKEHAESVLKSVAAVANSVKQIFVPAPYKDVSDYMASFFDEEQAKRELSTLIEKTAYAIKPLPIFSIREMEEKYRLFIKQQEQRTFSLNRFLPTLGLVARKLVPGELVMIMADTGVGKTAIMQSLARSASPLPTLFFELELPLPMMFERFVQMEMGCTGREVEEEYRSHEIQQWKIFKGLNHIMVCPESGIAVDQIEDYITKSALKFGQSPVVVCVDYVGLVKGGFSKSRYERISECAEQLKVIAKRTDTIVVMGSQIGREAGTRNNLEVHLHDAKDSGSLENSAGLVLGAWRPAQEELRIKVLKNTKGKSGEVIVCNFDGARMQITERADG